MTCVRRMIKLLVSTKRRPASWCRSKGVLKSGAGLSQRTWARETGEAI